MYCENGILMNLPLTLRLICHSVLLLFWCIQRGMDCSHVVHQTRDLNQSLLKVNSKLREATVRESSINEPDNDARMANDGVERTMDRSSNKNSRDPLWKLISSSLSVPLQRPSHAPAATIFNAVVDFQVSQPSTKSREPPSHAETVSLPSHLNLQMRLQKLAFYFSGLEINDEDCRLRLLCELAQDPVKFSPLSSIFLDETRYNGEVETLTAHLLTSNAGAQLLAYIEAVRSGEKSRDCSVWTYRCPRSAELMVNYKALLIWREISKWLTIQVLASNRQTKLD